MAFVARLRLTSLALVLFVVCLASHGTLALPADALAAPSPPSTSGLLNLPAHFQVEVASSETDDLIVEPIDLALSAPEVMRSRPFILNWNANPAFQIAQTPAQQLTLEQSREELGRLLDLRGAGQTTRTQAMRLFDDPQVTQIIPSPTLRTSLLLLYDLDPYHAVIESILEGNNDTGLPFAAVEFADLPVENAVATIYPPSAGPGGRYRLQISTAFAAEPPLQLAPAIIHESLHGDGINSSEEELAANILDTISYGELLLIDPSSAFDGTELSAYNNIQLYALLNSIGARGGGHVGISTSVSGDVFVGPGLEDFDAASIRDSILQDPFYGSLGSGDTTLPPTASALIARFPGDDALGKTPVYDEHLLALIDRGVSHVVTPEKARDLALILGLSATRGSSESSAAVVQSVSVPLESRPFVPVRPALFDLNQSKRPGTVTSERTMRQALAAALKLQPTSPAERSAELALFEASDIVQHIPDAQLRAAAVLLGSLEPWSETIDGVLDPGGQTFRWQISFAPLPIPVNALYVPSPTGEKSVLINEFLIGESLEATAAALLEGILLEGDRRSPNGAVVAALMSTLAYADLLELNPDAAANLTWGTINRNTDLLALLNSSQWTSGLQSDAESAIGFLAPANGSRDVLPGLVRDALSFQSYVLSSPRATGAEDMSISFPSELLVGLANTSGVPLQTGPSGAVIDQAALQLLDTRVGNFITTDDLQILVDALHLGVAI